MQQPRGYMACKVFGINKQVINQNQQPVTSFLIRSGKNNMYKGWLPM